MAWVDGAWMLLVHVLLVCVHLTDSSHMCYDCARIPYPRECDHVTTCSDDSRCYVEKAISDSGRVIYNVGCRSAIRCQSLERRRQNTDDVTGDLIICDFCCQGDYCNSQGCRAEPLPPLSLRGPVCFNCHQQAAHNTCDIVTVCDLGESCYMSTRHSGTGTVVTETGCEKTTACRGQTIPEIAVGRRSTTSCSGCCSDDYCNRDCSTLHAHGYFHTDRPTAQSTSFAFQTSTTTTTGNHNTHHVTVTTGIASSQTTHVITTHATTTTHSPEISSRLCELMGYTFTAAFRTCYKLYNDANRLTTWSQSRGLCKKDGGDLISFKTVQEEVYFADLILKNNRLDLPRFWVGASNQNLDQVWRWLDGRSVEKAYFHPKEPNNGNGAGEHCGALAQFQVHGNISLNDDNCDVHTNFICQIAMESLHSTPVVATRSHCRNDDYTYIPGNGMCYKIYNRTQLIQSEARATCRGHSADLLILRNSTVEHFFQKLHFYNRDESLRYWLGGERVAHNNRYDDFRWYNGHILDRNLEWFDGEPNNMGGENCLTFTFFFSKNLEFALNDDICSKQHYYICEEKCPDLTYEYFPALDLCFKIYDVNVTWTEARDRCRQDHADLLEPDTWKKLTFFQSYLNLSNTAVEKFWIGARDENHDRKYEWMTSSKIVPADFWHSTEPSVLSAHEHCAALHYFPMDHTLLLNDLNCDSTKIRFICQDIW